MQFRVPQNISLEDRIVGPLTAIQFGICVIGGGVAFLVFGNLSLPSIVREGGALLIAMTTVALALGKFNDQPMYRFVRHIFYFVFRPKVRVWHKGGHEVNLIKASSAPKHTEQAHTSKRVSKRDIAQLALLIDSRGRQGAKPQVHVPDPPAS